MELQSPTQLSDFHFQCHYVTSGGGTGRLPAALQLCSPTLPLRVQGVCLPWRCVEALRTGTRICVLSSQWRWPKLLPNEGEERSRIGIPSVGCWLKEVDSRELNLFTQWIAFPPWHYSSFQYNWELDVLTKSSFTKSNRRFPSLP